MKTLIALMMIFSIQFSFAGDGAKGEGESSGPRIIREIR